MKTELTVSTIVILAVIGKFFHLPTNAVLIISTSVLSMLYFLGAAYFFRAGKFKANQALLSAICGVLFSIIPIALVFKIQVWTSHDNLVLASFLACAVALILVLATRPKFIEKDGVFIKRLLIRSVALMLISSAMFLISTPTWLSILHRNNPEVARIRTLYYENPDNEEYRLRNDSLFNIDGGRHMTPSKVN